MAFLCFPPIDNPRYVRSIGMILGFRITDNLIIIQIPPIWLLFKFIPRLDASSNPLRIHFSAIFYFVGLYTNSVSSGNCIRLTIIPYSPPLFLLAYFYFVACPTKSASPSTIRFQFIYLGFY